ncbi:hypothetical protein [Haloplasma contractile]|uniref:ATP-binding region ATPase domain-containing protein n=1 Tax=Haloplasma contractile SSD-17B TaxID=1033810 RepID=U2DZ12_9MOLU|nr:hypothetical protein [Haloplasma contractile]ERJ13472.1 ATP-binding region ATPase domain-containing protein [Haloplasma contractile SSD-17B]
MKHAKKRLLKIVDELLNYFFLMGATNLNVNVKEEKEQYVIFFEGNYKKKHKKKIDRLVRCLEFAKQEDMEEYFWELAGDCDLDSELSLVGMMTDDIEIDIGDEIIKMKLIRYK